MSKVSPENLDTSPMIQETTPSSIQTDKTDSSTSSNPISTVTNQSSNEAPNDGTATVKDTEITTNSSTNATAVPARASSTKKSSKSPQLIVKPDLNLKSCLAGKDTGPASKPLSRESSSIIATDNAPDSTQQSNQVPASNLGLVSSSETNNPGPSIDSTKAPVIQNNASAAPTKQLDPINTNTSDSYDCNVIHSPTPTKPIENILKKTDKAKSPQLKVKPDLKLKSCLNMPTLLDVHEEPLYSHTSFDIRPDVISPNGHGLLQLNEYGAFCTPEEANSQSSLGFTPITSSNNIAYSPPPLKQSAKHTDEATGASSINNPKKTFFDNLRSNSSSIASEASYTRDNKLHLLIGVTGCISVHKNIYLIIEKLFQMYGKDKLEIQIILTKTAELFLTDKLYKFENMGVKIWFADDGIKHYLNAKAKLKQHLPSNTPLTAIPPSIISQCMLAYDLQKWTDVLLLAPLSANTMAKLINGLADNLLTDLLHLWPFPGCDKMQAATSSPSLTNKTVLANIVQSPKPIIAAIALTSSMYSHPITKRQLALLQETYPNMSILKPVEKCVDVDGNISMGGMRSWPEVVDFVAQKLGSPLKEEDEDEDDDDMPNESRDDTIASKDQDDFDDEDDDDDDDEDDDDDNNKDDEEKEEEEVEDDDHKVVELQPIIQENAKTIEKIIRSRHNTLTRKELEEHEKLAEKNAIINSTGIINSQV